MKRLFAVLGVFALLGTLLVLASSSPASAGGGPLQIHNEDPKVDLEASAQGCGYDPITVAAPAFKRTDIEVPLDCSSWTVTIVDPAGECTVESKAQAGGAFDQKNVQTIGLGGRVFALTNDCIREPINFEIDKDMTKEKESDNEIDNPAGVLTTWTFNFTPSDDRCTEAMTFELTGDNLPPPAADDSDEAKFEVITGFIENNAIVWCKYTVVETQVNGWTLTNIETQGAPTQCYDTDVATLTAIVDAGCASEQFDRADLNFWNDLDPIPLTVTKTFTGRDYYTTVDRADFHIYTPGLCGAFVMDPFGGLLGSIGVFRTINASQLPQVVAALPHTPPAIFLPGGDDSRPTPGACTYRVQENNAPEGCVALNPDGSNADGPYWEQTWVSGETTEFTFNIVNDCAETPEPTPEPTVAPTTQPKKSGAKPGAKKPSGGGSTAPKFTG